MLGLEDSDPHSDYGSNPDPDVIIALTNFEKSTSSKVIKMHFFTPFFSAEMDSDTNKKLKVYSESGSA
jgi:hypothetical protein